MTPPDDAPTAQPRLLSNRQLEMISDAFVERHVQLPCPRCGNAHFGIENGLAYLNVQDATPDVVIGATAIPAAITVCGRCGYVALHALGVLNLLNNEDFRHAADADHVNPEQGPRS